MEDHSKLTLEQSLRVRQMKDNLKDIPREELENLCEFLMIQVCHRENISKEIFKNMLRIPENE